MESLTSIFEYLLFPVVYLTQPTSQYFLPTYFSAGLCAIVIYVLRKRKSLRFKNMLALVLPPKLLEHESTKLDLKLVFFGLYYVLAQSLVVGGLTVISVGGVVGLMTKLFGRPFPLSGPSYFISGITMLLVFLAVEFGYWFSHLLMHKIPALWEFHKVHHSAEVLTPLTEWRQHPIELALFPCLVGFAATVVQGPFIWYFGAAAQVVDPLKTNLLSMVFWYSILHLRHSELPFYATGLLGKIIQAPAHHQVHHSTNPQHFDKNLGYCLSIWDWAFGTLYVPKKGEKFSFGLGQKDNALETLVGSMVVPFGRAGAIIFKISQSTQKNS